MDRSDYENNVVTPCFRSLMRLHNLGDLKQQDFKFYLSNLWYQGYIIPMGELTQDERDCLQHTMNEIEPHSGNLSLTYLHATLFNDAIW